MKEVTLTRRKEKKNNKGGLGGRGGSWQEELFGLYGPNSLNSQSVPGGSVTRIREVDLWYTDSTFWGTMVLFCLWAQSYGLGKDLFF